MGFHALWEAVPCAPVASTYPTEGGIPVIRSMQSLCSLRVRASSRLPHCRSPGHSFRKLWYARWSTDDELCQIPKKPGLQDGGMLVNVTCWKESLQPRRHEHALHTYPPTNKITQHASIVTSVQHVTDALVDKLFVFNIVKIAVLIGIFSLQDYHQAWASTEIAGAVQTISWFGDIGDISTGFTSAFLLIFFSELGDKTFFIAALLASRKSSVLVFIGTFGALVVMTIICVFLGRTFHYVDGILPFRLGETELPLDDLAAVCLLVYFGVSTLWEANSNDGSKGNDEQEEAEMAIAGFSRGGVGSLAIANVLVSTFSLVFIAEWGDKSFFSTIALAAASSPLGVVGGAIAGHGVATLIAILGGSLLGTYISEKVIAYTTGVLFLIFAITTLFEIFY